MRFLLDHDLPRRLAAALDALDSERTVAALRDLYGENAKDADWIPRAAEDGYALLSLDQAQARKTSEGAALRAHRLTVVYLGPFFAKRQFWSQAEWLVRHWPTIAAWIEASPKGTVGTVQETGTIRSVSL